MRGTFGASTAILALLIAPALLSAKGDTVRITIAGGDLAVPIEINGPAVSPFQVYTGPGTSSNEAHGLNIDWSAGVAEPPKGVVVYQVSFVTTRPDHGTYVVHYAIDPATNKGYVYLPGKGESEYHDNVWQILHGNEGHWFHAWSEWEKVANPLITKARTAH